MAKHSFLCTTYSNCLEASSPVGVEAERLLSLKKGWIIIHPDLTRISDSSLGGRRQREDGKGESLRQLHLPART